jgi:hypothetical protein
MAGHPAIGVIRDRRASVRVPPTLSREYRLCSSDQTATNRRLKVGVLVDFPLGPRLAIASASWTRAVATIET